MSDCPIDILKKKTELLTRIGRSLDDDIQLHDAFSKDQWTAGYHKLIVSLYRGMRNF
jgi:hypothetical protein